MVSGRRGRSAEPKISRQTQSLKEIITIRPVEVAAQHTAVLETGGRNCMGTDRYGQVFREALFVRSLRGSRVLLVLQRGNPSCAYL